MVAAKVLAVKRRVRSMKVIFFICLYELGCKGTKKNGDVQKNYSFFIIEYSTSPREEACEGVMYEWVT
jgi:hypothetical protein